MEKETVRISVRNLIEFIMRSGDLDSRSSGLPDKEAMQLGSKLHRKIQRSMGAGYRAEVALKYQKEYPDFFLTVEGRADGITEEKERVLIDEIKGTYRSLGELKEPERLHVAQAKCYAYLYGVREEKRELAVQITYCHLEEEELCRFVLSCPWKELEDWFEELLEAYRPWAQFQVEWKRIRNASMQGLEFPFPYREGQRMLTGSVYRTILRRKQLFIQAPTGVGKTMSVVFPAVRALGEGLGEKIFYLTARTIARTVAEEAFSILGRHGLQFKVVTLTAKEKLCVCEEMVCDPIRCPRAKGHFDRINEAVYTLLTEGDTFDRETLLAHSERFRVCPYEMSLELALWVDGVICDYNYVFDPRVHLRRFFSEGHKVDYLFLIDEAHNLVERGREMYSASLCKESFLELRRKLRGHSPKLQRALNRCNSRMLELKRQCEGEYQVLKSLGSLPVSLMNLQGELENLLEETTEEEFRRTVLEFYFQVRSFLNICDLLDEHYVIYAWHDGEGKFHIRLFCVNPARNLQQCLSLGRSAVFFSATLLPITYYKKLLGSEDGEDYAIYADSPFPQVHRALLIGRDVSSRYTRRGHEEYRRLARYIERVISQKSGNYMVFFPSYRMLEEVYATFCLETSEHSGHEWRCLVQRPLMSEREREEFLRCFTDAQGGSTVGFCILGGIFAEGIDLVGERLIGALIVGTGLPQIGREREIIMKYYDALGENGFDYAYRFPGMNKVLQAAGRVIRTKEDRGVILLLDDRFLREEYRRLFPREWADISGCVLGEVEPLLRDFWDRQGIP